MANGVAVVSATQITATKTAHAVGAVDFVITTPNGTTSEGTNAYTYGAVPTFATINPTSGPIAGGTMVTITGTNLWGANARVKTE